MVVCERSWARRGERGGDDVGSTTVGNEGSRLGGVATAEGLMKIKARGAIDDGWYSRADEGDTCWDMTPGGRTKGVTSVSNLHWCLEGTKCSQPIFLPGGRRKTHSSSNEYVSHPPFQRIFHIDLAAIPVHRKDVHRPIPRPNRQPILSPIHTFNHRRRMATTQIIQVPQDHYAPNLNCEAA